ncbi:MAG TPA: hypothetical protein VL992_03160 [Tepidisphaeraceae bacterium]|nr:hypothetical protein [Tepidisphaeraceae bacterium]
MKTLILIPIVVASALAAAAGLCRLAGVPLHGRDLLLAAGVAVVAAEAGMIPAILLRRSDPELRAQAALGGTVVHMLLTILIATAVMVARVVEPATPFVVWLTGAYWLSLGLLVWGLIGLAARQPVKAK